MNLDTDTLVAGLVLGCVGLGFFKHGKTSSKPLHLVAGVGLMVAPYLIESMAPLLVTSGVLIALPFTTRWL